MKSGSLNVDKAVRERYSAASSAREAALCCPVDYDRTLLEVIPKEVIDRDYGCGDPSRYVKEGEIVLDLGSGGGKICFMAAQIVGSKGKVIGIDTNDEMLRLARDSSLIVSEKIGYHNVEFRKGMIQDLKLDRQELGVWLSDNPVSNEEDLRALEQKTAQMRDESPMIADDSIDVVVSNCVLNLVDTEKKDQMFEEIFRVLKPGGRAVISDIVSDEEVPFDMQNDPELWSGCISGAYQEMDFLDAFEDTGFVGINLDKRDDKPWQTVQGIEFRSVTVVAYKPLDEFGSHECHEALIYKGPFKVVQDEEGLNFVRGQPVAVSHETYLEYSRGAYSEHFFGVEPLTPVDLEDAEVFERIEQMELRDPSETKGVGYKATDSTSAEEKDTGSTCC